MSIICTQETHTNLYCDATYTYPLPIQAAENLGKMGISAALAVGNIVKTKIEEEIHKHQHGEGDKTASSEASLDAVGGEDVQEEDDADDAAAAADTSATNDENKGTASKGEEYFSDGSSAASPR